MIYEQGYKPGTIFNKIVKFTLVSTLLFISTVYALTFALDQLIVEQDLRAEQICKKYDICARKAENNE